MSAFNRDGNKYEVPTLRSSAPKVLFKPSTRGYCEVVEASAITSGSLVLARTEFLAWSSHAGFSEGPSFETDDDG